MNIHKKTESFVKNLNRRPTLREIEFYHKNKLIWKKLNAIFRELIYIVKGVNLSAKSAQITYTFILAIVPFLSILFTFIHSFHGFENIFSKSLSPLIKKQFGHPVGDQISIYLQQIIQNIQVKELGIISFITFSITVIFLLLSIEDNFNSIMHMQNHRNFFQRFLKCWIIITVSPFLFALSAINSDPLIHLIRESVPLFLEGSLIKSLRIFLGLAFQSIYFIFIYYVMPSKRLNFKSVLVGGIVASILLEALQYINVFLAKTAISNDPSKVYGTVPLIAVLFFAWIRLGWIVTLLGAACSLASQRIFYFNKDASFKDFPAREMIQCISIYCAISKIYKESGFPVPINRISVLTKISLDEVRKWSDFLIKKGVVFSSYNSQFICYSPTYKALHDENNTDEFLKEILFLNHSHVIKNYNDIEKYFILCLKGVSLK